jgi:hypothetical protein
MRSLPPCSHHGNLVRTFARLHTPGVRKNERERLARRAAYQHARRMAVPSEIELPYGMSVEEFDRLSDFDTAYHEAGHAVAAWIQGFGVSMRYVPKGELTNGHDYEAVTSRGSSFEKFLTKPPAGSLKFNKGVITDSTGATVGIVDDGGVLARQQAFVTFAGPLAETLGRKTGLPDSVYKEMFEEHAIEARSKLRHFSCESAEELHTVYDRLLDLAAHTFRLAPVQHCVKVLAERFYEERSLSEQQVRKTIEAAWNDAARAIAAKAGE